VFSLNHTSQSQSGKHDTGTWQAADGSSGATYDNLGSETKNSRANLSGRVQNGSVYYDGIDVYQTRNTSTDNTGSGFALGSTTNSHTVGSTQTTETRGGNSGSWYGSKLESGNSTTNYTTVSGTMGQPFSGMTQTGFYTTTQYGTAAQTGITGMYGYGQTAPSDSTLLPNIPAPNVGNYPPDAQNKLERIYNAYRQSAVNQSYYASQYANRPGANFVAPSLTGLFQQINASVINGNLKPDVDQSKWDALDYAANFSAGWADTFTFGVTDKFRSTFGFNDGIDHGSATYKAGQIGGMVHSVALGGGGTASIAIRVPTIRYVIALNGGGALSIAPTMATTITIVGTPQAGMVVAGGLGILHARRIGQNGDDSNLGPSPRTPVGRSGQQHIFPNANAPHPRNLPTTINGRNYSGHAIDRMQERGFVPSVIENAIQNGTATLGKKPGTTVFTDLVNDLRVIIDTATGRVVTIIPGV
jgi:filamentous hemagglutinin